MGGTRGIARYPYRGAATDRIGKRSFSFLQSALRSSQLGTSSVPISGGSKRESRTAMMRALCPRCGHDTLVALFITSDMLRGTASVLVDCPNCLSPFDAALAENPGDHLQ